MDSEAISDLYSEIRAYTGTISPIVSLHGQQTALWKSRQVYISQLSLII